MNNKLIYVDNSATTKISDNVFNAMLPYLKENYGNPSSVYSIGRDAKKAIELSRDTIAQCLNASDSREIYFTGCGTESNNWAIKSVAYNMKKNGKTHIITTNFEHHATLHTCQRLEKEGFEVTYLPVDSDGYIQPSQVANVITEKTGLCTIMYANNEIGTIQPIPEIGKICRENNVIFHTDAVQAIGNVKIDVQDQNIDMLSFTGHKIYAPKGVGGLYVKRNILLQNFIDGGAQERNKRGGTENLASIVALGVAFKDVTSNIDEKVEKITKMRNYLIDEILKTIPKSRLNGGRDVRLAGNLNISFEAIEGEALLLRLDMAGICASSGSACTSGSLDPSHVLMAIGLPHEIAHGSLRISINEHNTQEELDYILKELPPIIELLRAMSPIWNG